MVRQAGATMNDVARAANVSLKTVSRFVNGETNIDPELAKRIDAAVKSLGYRRNLAAASLRPGWSSKLIGLVIADLGNPFYSTLAATIEEVVAESGYVLTISSSSNDPGRFDEVLDRFMQLRVDGLVIVPPRLPGRTRSVALDANAPVIYVDRPGQVADADCVFADNHGGALTGTRALLQSGARKIAFIADSLDVHPVRQRLSGFEEAIKSAGLGVETMPVYSGIDSADEASELVKTILDSEWGIDAFFAANNRMTLGVLRGCTEAGRVIPVVGFDDFEAADLIWGGISVVRQDTEQMGREAARLLLGRIKGDTSARQTVVVPTTFISRGSEVPDGRSGGLGN